MQVSSDFLAKVFMLLESSNPTQLIAKIKHQAKAEMEFRWYKVTPFTIFGNESTVYHLLRTA